MAEADAARIDDYALIGDGRSAALVSRGGSIDWLCWPRFDSPSVFGALLDRERGGFFRIGPTAPARVTRRYVDETAALETRYETAAGTLVVTDAFVLADVRDRWLEPEHELVRNVACERGPMEMEVHYAPRPDYGRVGATRLRALGPLGFRLEHGSRLYTLKSEAKLIRYENGDVGGRIWLRPGEVRAFSLTYHEGGPAALAPPGELTRERLRNTLAYWRLWSAGTRYDGPHREVVVRSLITLKLLTYAPSGAIIGAPTTSLIVPGGATSWDERYGRVRDAARTARALYELGHAAEATAYVRWLLAAASTSAPAVHPLYDVYGLPVSPERELAHLDGHVGAKPVRVGNAAGRERRLGAYGEVLVAAAELVQRAGTLDRADRRLLARLTDYVCRHWREPDSVSELGAYLRRYTQSLAMSWVGLDRVLELHAKKLVTRIDAAAVAAERDRVRDEILSGAWSDSRSSYTHAAGDEGASATTLLVGSYGFEDAASARMRGTVERVRDELLAAPGLLYLDEGRRAAADAFAIGGFWLAEALARGGGSLDEADEAFASALARGNDVGLFAARTDAASGEPAGSFPQSATHAALLNAALALSAREAAEGRSLERERGYARRSRR